MSYLTSQDKMRYVMTHLQGELGERVLKEIRSHRTPNDASKKAAQEIRKRIIAATKKWKWIAFWGLIELVRAKSVPALCIVQRGVMTPWDGVPDSLYVMENNDSLTPSRGIIDDAGGKFILQDIVDGSKTPETSLLLFPQVRFQMAKLMENVGEDF